MAQDISIVISVKDNFSSAVTTMRNASNSFKKDLTELQEKLDIINKNKITLKVDTDKARSSLKDAEEAFKDLGIAAGNVKEIQKANDAYEKVRTKLYSVSKQAKETEENILKLNGAISKVGNKADDNTGIPNEGSLLSKLSSAGAFKMVGDTATNVAVGYAESAYGAEGGTMVSNVLSGAASGLSVGTVMGMGNPLAGLAGIVLGSYLGAINGIVEIEKEKDSYFKKEVESSYKNAMQLQDDMLLRGISIAAAREQEKVPAASISGSGEATGGYPSEMTGLAGGIEGQSKTYIGLVNALEEVQGNIDNAMGEGYIEERKKGIQAQIDYFEGDSGEKIKEANRMIGEWKASLENLEEEYQRDAIKAVMTGELSANFDSQEVKDRLIKMYKEYTEYAKEGTEDAGAKMGALFAEAQVIAQNEYNASDNAQLQLNTNLELIGKIRDDKKLQDEYWDAGYRMGNEFFKGRLAGTALSWYESKTRNIPKDFSYSGGGDKYAYGLSYVPYDNFPALLHQGERVLTASENRSLNTNTVPQVNITGNNFNVRSDDDIERIGNVIVKKFISVYEVM